MQTTSIESASIFFKYNHKNLRTKKKNYVTNDEKFISFNTNKKERLTNNCSARFERLHLQFIFNNRIKRKHIYSANIINSFQ